MSPSRSTLTKLLLAAALAGLTCARPGSAGAQGDPNGAAKPAGALPASRPAPAAPPTSPAPRVMVYGDRLAQALARGLDEEAGRWLAVSASTSEDAGLTRADFTEWLAALRARLQRPDRPSVAVMMLGSNDRRPLPDGPGRAEPDAPRWRRLYVSRVDAVAAAFHEAHVPLVWVGLPSVRGEAASADFVRLNALFRDRLTTGDCVFIDIWEAFSDDTGSYSAMGPDVDGLTVKLRKADGAGFTRAGARKLASFVERDVRRLGKAPTVPEDPSPLAGFTIDKGRDFDQALEIDVNAQIEREAGLPPGAGRGAAEPTGPVAGPVVSLSAPPLSPDGALATASIAPPGALQASFVVKGEPAPARRGRADDFSWPRP